MISKFDAWAVDHRDELHALLRKWFELERPLLLRSDLLETFDMVCDSHPQPLVNPLCTNWSNRCKKQFADLH